MRRARPIVFELAYAWEELSSETRNLVIKMARDVADMWGLELEDEEPTLGVTFGNPNANTGPAFTVSFFASERRVL